jgi:hypothetical protein
MLGFFIKKTGSENAIRKNEALDPALSNGVKANYLFLLSAACDWEVK